MERHQKEVVAIAAPLLFLKFAAYAVLLGLAGWALNEQLDKKLHGGNAATPYLIIFSLITGAVGLASVTLGYLSLSGKPESNAVAAASGLVAWVLSLLALGLAAKQIHVGKVHNKRLKALEAFAVIVSGIELLYLIAAHVGLALKSTCAAASTTAPAQSDRKPTTTETV
ncbi:hypothetical protein O6H91_12G033100 [Diphasiastrum complanatum]|uniref:Uncharacterized protein n=1 Tax=Diphasiastrum complanatum TaxID=34168 RepID=A0ACC2C091_DIPCM|nr:hypothetical protein O6H91_12G033100 [Diphasiastrum complanatum]